MSRVISTKKRFPKKDLKLKSFLITLFINRVLKNGKKQLAKNIVYKTLKLITLKTHFNSLRIFEKAIRNTSPKFYLKTIKTKTIKKQVIWRTTYQVPIVLTKFKSVRLGISWIIKYAKKRPGKNISTKLANEILDAFKQSGSEAVRHKEDIHEQAEANRVFLD